MPVTLLDQLLVDSLILLQCNTYQDSLINRMTFCIRYKYTYNSKLLANLMVCNEDTYVYGDLIAAWFS